MIRSWKWLLLFLVSFGPWGVAHADLFKTFTSKFVKTEVQYFGRTFAPFEAEEFVLPFMKEHPELFAGKEVFEIGGGTGVNSVYAAQLGAKKVVVTDISPDAIRSIRHNAALAGFDDRIDVRFVEAENISAYSKIKKSEKFDTIFSNPPYTFDVDAKFNSAVIDNGKLGPSILTSLKKHLKPGGTAFLLYRSIFSQQVMVQFAQQLGLKVHFFYGDKLDLDELDVLAELGLKHINKKLGLNLEKKLLWPEDAVLEFKIPQKPRRENEFPGMIIIKND